VLADVSVMSRRHFLCPRGKDAAAAEGKPGVTRRPGSSYRPRLPVVSNCKPSLLNVLPLPVGPRLPQMDFEPIFDGPFSAKSI